MFILSSVMNTSFTWLWGSGGRTALQGLHFCFAIGAIVSPIVTQPFLAPRVEDVVSVSDIIRDNSSDILAASTDHTILVNGNATYEQWDSRNNTESLPETRVFYAFLVSSMMYLTSGLLLLLLLRCDTGRKPRRRDQTSPDDVQGMMSSSPRILFFVVLVLMGLFFFTAPLMSLADLLMTFVVRKLDWSKTSGARVTSVFWVGLSVGRLTGIGLARLVSPTKILMFCMITVNISMLGILGAALLRIDWGIWVAVALAGFTLSPIFPSGGCALELLLSYI